MHRKKPQNISLKVLGMFQRDHDHEMHHGTHHIRHKQNGKLEHLHEHFEKNYPKLINPLS